MDRDVLDVLEGRKRFAVVTGDCLEVLPLLESGCVDAVVTDPPYGIRHSSSKGATWQDTTIDGDTDTSLRDAVVAWAGKLPSAAFGSWKQPPPVGTKETLVWDKGPAFGMGDLRFPWKRSWEEIYILGNGWSGKRDEGVLRGHIVVSWESHGRMHPHEKPVSLIIYLLDKLPADIVVLDPFCGSGTTGVACLQTGRRFIGIEIDPRYAAIARRRCEQAEREQREILFPAIDAPRQQTIEDLLSE